MWETHDEFLDKLAGAWSTTSCRNASEMKDKLEAVLSSLSSWGKDTFGGVQVRIRALKNELSVPRSQRGRIESLRMPRSRQ
jgi:hypothetical protein